MADTSPPSDRHVLSSWKEIAAYLRVDVRTVQRWHKGANLPIYRHPTGERSHPYAYADELDRWVVSGGATAPHGARGAAVPVVAAAPAPASGEPARPRARWLAAFIVAATLGASAWWWLGLTGVSCAPARVRLDGARLTALDAEGHACWGLDVPEFAGAEPTGLPMPLDDWVVRDADGDGRPEVLVNVPSAGPSATSGRLVAFDAAGRQRWTFTYGRARSWAGRDFSAMYDGRLVRTVEVDGRPHVLAVAWHNVWFPAQVVLLDGASGRLVDEYWHPGALHFASIADLDGDGRSEVVLAGVNNPGPGLGHPVLVTLALPFSRTSPRAGGMSAFTGGREAAYRVFPRPDLCTVAGRIPFVTSLSVEGRERLYVRVACDESTFVYTLDPRLQVVDARFSDNVFAHHDRLQRQGDLDHELSADEQRCLQRVLAPDTAVDGNGAELDRFWAGCR